MLADKMRMGAGGAIYKISDACMFDSGNSDYMHRTPSVAGNRKTWTFSTWVKRGKIGTYQALLAAGVVELNINPTNHLEFYVYAGAVKYLASSAVYRDIAAWLNIICTVDTTEATASNRVKIWVNNVQVTEFSTATYPNLNDDLAVNNTVTQYVGVHTTGGQMNGYLSDTYLVDGLALTPNSFGELDVNNTWVPKAYAGAYGTNGFYLDFADAADLGDDESGNGNDWTESGIDSTNQVSDTPTDNFCVLNGIHEDVSTLSKGNLAATGTCQGTFDANAFASYWEVTAGGSAPNCGVISEDGATTHVVAVTAGKVFGFRMTAAGNVDYINITDAGSWTNITNALTGVWFPYGTAQSTTWNFGQRTFTGTAVGDELSVVNISDPAILDPRAQFDVDLYTGTGAELERSALDFQPDLVWIKNRDAADDHKLTDSIRGATKSLESNTLAVEATEAQGLKSFDADGFTLGTDVSYNTSAEKYVAWCFKEGVTPGFDIVSYTGNGTSARQIPHGLGVVPGVIIHKARGNGAYAWNSWHVGLSTDYYISLNTTNVQDNSVNIWPTAGITSGYITTTSAAVKYNNLSGIGHIAYLFASVEGFSKFGKYTGNGNANGSFVYCGFRPAFVMCKSIDSTSDWFMYDNQREGYNVDNDHLDANTTDVEATADEIDLLSNGFKLRIATDPNIAETYIFMAFAEAPFKTARAR